MHFSYFKENDCYKIRSYELATLFVTRGHAKIHKLVLWCTDEHQSSMSVLRFQYKLGQAGRYSSCCTVMWMHELHYRKLGIMEEVCIFHIY
jgi:hypothetical protein